MFVWHTMVAVMMVWARLTGPEKSWGIVASMVGTFGKRDSRLSHVAPRGRSFVGSGMFPVEQNCDLKLCDFGLSRGVQDDHETGDLTE